MVNFTVQATPKEVIQHCHFAIILIEVLLGLPLQLQLLQLGRDHGVEIDFADLIGESCLFSPLAGLDQECL